MHEDMEDIDHDVQYSPPADLSDAPGPFFRGFGESLASTAGQKYNTAMLGVQKQLETLLIADKNNPFTKSKFASLGQLLATVKPVLNANGFLVKQFSGTVRTHGPQTKRWYSKPIITLITHVESGQWEAIVVDLPVETTVYSYGSAMTFGKRYGLQSYLGIATTDDDGAATIQKRLDEQHNAKVSENAILEINKCKTTQQLTAWLDENRDALNSLPDGQSLTTIRDAYAVRRKAIEAQNDVSPETAKRKRKSPEGDVGPGSET